MDGRYCRHDKSIQDAERTPKNAARIGSATTVKKAVQRMDKTPDRFRDLPRRGCHLDGSEAGFCAQNSRLSESRKPCISIQKKISDCPTTRICDRLVSAIGGSRHLARSGF